MITIEQYKAFIESGGYTNDEYWPKHGLTWRKELSLMFPLGWDNQIEQEYLNQPVSGVSWYEAAAYCNWMSEQLEPYLPQGYRVFLPSEAGWEAAAAYNVHGHRQTYPWGEYPATSEHGIYDWGKGPSSVGLGLIGQSDCGTQDSVGTL